MAELEIPTCKHLCPLFPCCVQFQDVSYYVLNLRITHENTVYLLCLLSILQSHERESLYSIVCPPMLCITWYVSCLCVWMVCPPSIQTCLYYNHDTSYSSHSALLPALFFNPEQTYLNNPCERIQEHSFWIVFNREVVDIMICRSNKITIQLYIEFNSTWSASHASSSYTLLPSFPKCIEIWHLICTPSDFQSTSL